jgi:hypothetical protein
MSQKKVTSGDIIASISFGLCDRNLSEIESRDSYDVIGDNQESNHKI